MKCEQCGGHVRIAKLCHKCRDKKWRCNHNSNREFERHKRIIKESKIKS